MTALLYRTVVYEYYLFVALLLFFYQLSSGVHYKIVTPVTPCVRLRKKYISYIMLCSPPLLFPRSKNYITLVNVQALSHLQTA